MMSRNSSRNAPGSPARSLRAWRCCKGATAIAACLCFAAQATAEPLSSQQQLAFDIYKELVEINTVTATGDTLRAAETMAARLRANGIAAVDVQVFNPAPRKGNLVARNRGAQADPAARASRRRRSEARGLVGRSIHAPGERWLLLRTRLVG